MSNLIEFLLQLVQNPEMAAQFRTDPAALLADADLSDEETVQLQQMLDAQVQLPPLKTGVFYAGNDRGHHVFAISTVTYTTAAESPDPLNNRLQMKKGGKKDWPNPKRLTLSSAGDHTVRLDHLIDSDVQLTGTVLELTIEIDDSDDEAYE